MALIERCYELFVFSLVCHISPCWAMPLLSAEQQKIAMDTNVVPGGRPVDDMLLLHLMDAMEDRLEQRILKAEESLEQRFNEKLRPYNQTLTVKFLELWIHSLSEELQLSKENAEKQAHLLQHFQQRAMEQHRELGQLRRHLQEIARKIDTRRKQEQSTETPLSLDEMVTLQSRIFELLTDDSNTISTMPSSLLLPIDCGDAFEKGVFNNVQGEYKITVEPFPATSSFDVSCQVTNDTAWTLIQRRRDGSTDFYRGWEEYKQGFGQLDGEFWLGNERIFRLTNQRDYQLRIEMSDWRGQHFWAEYDHFRISDEEDNYRLHVSGYRGNAGDSLTASWNNHDNHQFSTRDRDNDARYYDSCAQHYRGGWWFTTCFESHLNGIYYVKGLHDNFFVRNGIQWNTIHHHSSLRSAAMMIRPNRAANSDLRQTFY